MGPKEGRLSQRAASLQLASFLFGMTADEKRLVSQISELVLEHNRSLCGDLVVPGGLQQYGHINVDNHFDFYPQTFLAPLRHKLALQEGLVSTQLFVSFLERFRDEDEKKNIFRIFIRDFIYFYYFVQKKKRHLK